MKVIHRKAHKEAQTNFVSLAAHQLRTLPNIIGWDIESLLMKKQGLSKADREILHKAASTNKRMIDLIDIMLNISRIELGTVTISPENVNIVECINEELVLLHQATKKHLPRIITKYPAQPCVLSSDKNFIRVILQNLLSNAMKYTPSTGNVSIVVTKRDKMCKIEVTDTGCGIPKAQQKYVFDKLFRADNARRKLIPGNGLGLHLTQALVKLLRGKIWFVSSDERGSSFFVELPYRGLRKRDGSTALAIKSTYMAPLAPGGK